MLHLKKISVALTVFIVSLTIAASASKSTDVDTSLKRDLPRYGEWIWYDCVAYPGHYFRCEAIPGGKDHCAIGVILSHCQAFPWDDDKSSGDN